LTTTGDYRTATASMLSSFYPSSNSLLRDPWKLRVFWPLPVSNPAFAKRIFTARRCVVESGLQRAADYNSIFTGRRNVKRKKCFVGGGDYLVTATAGTGPQSRSRLTSP
jgi:hypothetical protein